MNKSESIKELSAALSKAQGAIVGAIKDSNNPFFKSQYADLSSIWEACRDQLSKNGLAIIQSPEEAESGISIETMLCHSSGEWVSSSYVMPVSKVDAQAVGSAITYARRYALAAMVGVAPVDDDGNAAAKNPPTQNPLNQAQEKKISDKQLSTIVDMCTSIDVDINTFAKYCKVSSLEELPASKFDKAMQALRDKKNEKEKMEDVPQ